MTYLGSNIKVLRIEARLSIEELSEKSNIDKDKIIAFEKGKEEPTIDEIKILCPYLRIGFDDMMDRDIKAERDDAGIRMRKSKERNNYNWYLGDRKIIAIYLVYFLSMILLFILATLFIYLVTKGGITKVDELGNIEKIPFPFINCLLIGYEACVIPCGICTLIWLAKRFKYRFMWWHIFFISFITIAIGITGELMIIPSLVYSIYKVLIKKGRN